MVSLPLLSIRYRTTFFPGAGNLGYIYPSRVPPPRSTPRVRSASELGADRSGMTMSERPSVTCQNCIVLPFCSSSFFLPHRLIFIASSSIRHLDLWHKTTADESKTILPSQPPVLFPFSDSLPSFQTLDNDDLLLPQRHNI